jgi:hypothetical protein
MESWGPFSSGFMIKSPAPKTNQSKIVQNQNNLEKLTVVDAAEGLPRRLHLELVVSGRHRQTTDGQRLRTVSAYDEFVSHQLVHFRPALRIRLQHGHDHLFGRG